jgi:hypothetical protein
MDKDGCHFGNAIKSLRQKLPGANPLPIQSGTTLSSGALDSDNDIVSSSNSAATTPKKITLGHPLHPSLLAFAFKVLHMKGRGGSGEGRVVFCRVYSGEIRDPQLRTALRRATLSQQALPVMASTALMGKGVEPVLDAIADLLPSPLDRLPPALINGAFEFLGRAFVGLGVGVGLAVSSSVAAMLDIAVTSTRSKLRNPSSALPCALRPKGQPQLKASSS